MRLLNYETMAKVTLKTGQHETVACGPVWCRIGVLGDDELVRLDLVRADGSSRRRVAGNEATPATVDVSLLDRYVPLANASQEPRACILTGVGLSLCYEHLQPARRTWSPPTWRTWVPTARSSGGPPGVDADLTWYPSISHTPLIEALVARFA